MKNALTFLITNPYIHNTLIALGAVLLASKTLFLSVMFLVVIDLITGIWAALKRKEKITSKKLSYTISKIILYTIALISGIAVHEVFKVFSVTLIVNMIAAFLAITEFKSIAENISSILGIDFAGFIKKLIRRKLNDVDEMMTDDKKEEGTK